MTVNDSSQWNDQAPSPQGRRGFGRRVFAITMMIAAVALLAWQIQRAGPRALLESIAAVSVGWIAVILGLTLLRYLVASARLAVITRLLLPVRIAPFLSIVFVSQLLGIAIPGLRVGATLLRAHLAARRFGGGTALHMGPNILDQLLLALSWLIVALALAPLLILRGDDVLGRSSLVYMLLAMLLAGIAFWIFKRRRHRLIDWLSKPRPGRRGRFALALRTTLTSMGTLTDDPRALLVGIVGGVVFVLLTGVTQHVALLALGANLPWWIAVLAVVIGTTLGTASGSPGGLGVTEAAQVAFLQAHGLELGLATAAVLIARGAYYLLISAGGLAGLAWEMRRGRLPQLFH